MVKITKPRVEFFELVKMLLDSKSWELKTRLETIVEMVHKEGFRYYPDGGCICLRNEELGVEQYAGVFEFMIIIFFANRNTKKVRRRPTEKQIFDRICSEGIDSKKLA